METFDIIGHLITSASCQHTSHLMMIISAISTGWQEALPLKAPTSSTVSFFSPDLVHFQPVNKMF